MAPGCCSGVAASQSWSLGARSAAPRPLACPWSCSAQTWGKLGGVGGEATSHRSRDCAVRLAHAPQQQPRAVNTTYHLRTPPWAPNAANSTSAMPTSLLRVDARRSGQRCWACGRVGKHACARAATHDPFITATRTAWPPRSSLEPTSNSDKKSGKPATRQWNVSAHHMRVH